MGAEIEVHNVISIAGRGAVLIGHLRAGTARVGQVSAPLDLGAAAARRLEVSAVERLSSMQAGGPAVGLVFRDPPQLGDLRRAFPAGSTLVLEEPGEG
jgi:translation elongation factor EF-Tu-like GTPase